MLTPGKRLAPILEISPSSPTKLPRRHLPIFAPARRASLCVGVNVPVNQRPPRAPLEMPMEMAERRLRRQTMIRPGHGSYTSGGIGYVGPYVNSHKQSLPDLPLEQIAGAQAREEPSAFEDGRMNLVGGRRRSTCGPDLVQDKVPMAPAQRRLSMPSLQFSGIHTDGERSELKENGLTILGRRRLSVPGSQLGGLEARGEAELHTSGKDDTSVPDRRRLSLPVIGHAGLKADRQGCPGKKVPVKPRQPQLHVLRRQSGRVSRIGAKATTNATKEGSLNADKKSKAAGEALDPALLHNIPSYARPTQSSLRWRQH